MAVAMSTAKGKSTSKAEYSNSRTNLLMNLQKKVKYENEHKVVLEK